MVISSLFLLYLTFIVENLNPEHVDKKWESYKETHNLNFELHEDSLRKDIFLENYLYIEKHNQQESSYKLAINKYAHLNFEELNHGLKIRANRKFKGVEIRGESNLPVARSVDWRKYGIVAPIKDQKRCGSCYSFSAISAIESAWAKLNGYLTELSEQEIVDCSQSFGNEGCEGGYMDHVFEFAMTLGVSEEKQYSYVGKDEKCLTQNMTHNFKILSYRDIPEGDEKELIRAVSFAGPVSVAIDASSRDFRFYESGVIDITSCSGTELNHGVVVVGYDLSGKIPYYIVRNSWGESWGEQGYIKMAIKKNMCGIATAASYPIVGA